MNTKTIIRVLFWFFFILTLLLAQLWLEFKTRDLKIQTLILQRYRLRLADYNKNLQTKILSLEKDDRLREIALKELKLVDTKLEELEYMTVPMQLLAKYKAVESECSVAQEASEEFSQQDGMRRLLNRILNPTQPSEAQQTQSREK
ncbi:MAG: hypothetical protein N2246_05150 [Candidatus Sumerlaeia bacterium]|nr:hypothetical protein [Candidatus Sumerlaeia bacterium]